MLRPVARTYQLGYTRYTLSTEEDGSLVVTSYLPGGNEHTINIVRLGKEGIHVTENRGHAPKPWQTLVEPMPEGGHLVDTRGSVLGFAGKAEPTPMDYMQAHPDMTHFRARNKRIFEVISRALKAAEHAHLHDHTFTPEQMQTLLTYTSQFTGVQMGAYRR